VRVHDLWSRWRPTRRRAQRRDARDFPARRYQINENALAALSVENLLNEQYTRHMTVFPNELTRTITGFPQPGIAVKGSLRVRFAGG
jgi:outer membrane receptor protein involved in Fe transport